MWVVSENTSFNLSMLVDFLYCHRGNWLKWNVNCSPNVRSFVVELIQYKAVTGLVLNAKFNFKANFFVKVSFISFVFIHRCNCNSGFKGKCFSRRRLFPFDLDHFIYFKSVVYVLFNVSATLWIVSRNIQIWIGDILQMNQYEYETT